MPKSMGPTAPASAYPSLKRKRNKNKSSSPEARKAFLRLSSSIDRVTDVLSCIEIECGK